MRQALMKAFVGWFLLMLLSTSGLRAQDPHFGFQWGIGSYGMKDLKSFNSRFIQGRQLEPVLIDDYPPYFFYRTSIQVNYEKFNYGILHSYQSTGSRYSLIDYSGEYLYDTRVKSNSFGILVEYNINAKGKLRYSILSEMGVISSTLVIEEVITIDESTLLDESHTLKARNGYWEPGARLYYPVSFFELYLNASFCLQFSGKGFYFTENRDMYLNQIVNSSDPVNPGWSGFRFGFGILINIANLAGS